MKQFWIKNKKWIVYVKTLLAVLTIAFIVYKLFVAYKIDEKFSSFTFDFSIINIIFLFLAIVLVLANWGLETAKWHLLINQFEKLSYYNSLKAIFSGVTLSIITPNQIGDFAGRVIHLQTLNKIKGSLITIIGHTAQVIVTGIFGSYALLAFAAKLDYDIYLKWKVIALVILIIHVLVVIAFLNIHLLYRLFQTNKWIKKYEQYIQIFNAYTKSQLAKLLVLSMLRYIVFLTQYVLLLYFFGVHIGFLNAIIGVISIFCIQSIVPSFILLDIGLRGASALFIFGELSNYDKSIELGVLLSAYSLWIINMMIPALLGLYFILKQKFTHL